MTTEPHINRSFPHLREVVAIMATIILLGIMQFINQHLLPAQQFKTEIAHIIVYVMACIVIYRCYEILRTVFGES